MTHFQIPTELRIRQLDLRIQLLLAALKPEPGMTDRARRLSERAQVLIKERNALRTRQQIERIERERGLSA